jgi:S-adenosylmethionine decarboxylase
MKTAAGTKPAAKKKRLKNSAPDGIHYLIEFFGCSGKYIDSVTHWEKLLSAAIAKADIKPLNSHFYKFAPHGITGYILLSASHIAIHTWPEYGYVACDVFSCGCTDETQRIVDNIQERVAHTKIKIRKMKRGFRVNTRPL